MKKFIVNSYQIIETQKWVPCGTLFETVDEDKINIQEADIFPPEFRFDTKDEADKFFRNYFSQRDYNEDTNK